MRPEALQPLLLYSGIDRGGWVDFSSLVARLCRRITRQLHVYVAPPLVVGLPRLFAEHGAMVANPCLNCRLHGAVCCAVIAGLLQARSVIDEPRADGCQGVPQPLDDLSGSYAARFVAGFGLNYHRSHRHDTADEPALLTCLHQRHGAPEVDSAAAGRYIEQTLMPWCARASAAIIAGALTA